MDESFFFSLLAIIWTVTQWSAVKEEKKKKIKKIIKLILKM